MPWICGLFFGLLPSDSYGASPSSSVGASIWLSLISYSVPITNYGVSIVLDSSNLIGEGFYALSFSTTGFSITSYADIY